MKKTILFVITALLLVFPVSADYDGKYDDIIDLIKSSYYGDVDYEQMETERYKGMLNALDPHSVYFSADDLKSFKESLSGSYVGIGVSVHEDNGFIRIISVFEGSPAERAGLESDDMIIAVAGESIENEPLETVIPRIKGHEGTTVLLTILKADTNKEVDLDVMRETIEIKSVKHKEVNGYDVFELSSFSEDTAIELKNALKTNPIEKGIIIDLRNNPGGALNVVRDIADIFLEKGQLITTIDYGKNDKMHYTAETPANKEKLAVLINKNSASASELFAGAMQDHKRGVVIGETSFGKGSVQSLFSLDDGSALKLTIAKYQTPSGKYIHGIGIEPDLKIDSLDKIDPKVKDFKAMNSLHSSSLGSKDIDTMAMQQRLNYLGYPLVIDGHFGQASFNALKQFEAKEQLTVDGILDVDTKDVLQTVFLKEAKKKYDAEMQAAINYLESH